MLFSNTMVGKGKKFAQPSNYCGLNTLKGKPAWILIDLVSCSSFFTMGVVFSSVWSVAGRLPDHALIGPESLENFPKGSRKSSKWIRSSWCVSNFFIRIQFNCCREKADFVNVITGRNRRRVVNQSVSIVSGDRRHIIDLLKCSISRH